MLGRATAIALALGYPVIVFVSLQLGGVKTLGFATLGVGAARTIVFAAAPKARGRRWDGVGLLLVFVGVVVLWSDAVLTALFYPVIVNFTMLGYFGWSVVRPPTVVEHIARLKTPDLPPRAVAYTRRVTLTWCAFFLVNGTIALYTALWTPIEMWMIYNSGIAYVAMGIMFAGEFLIRRRVVDSYETSDA